jgi:hypothetical protein
MGMKISQLHTTSVLILFQFQNKRARTKKTGGAMPPKRAANAPLPLDFKYDFVDDMPVYKNPALSTIAHDGVEIVEDPRRSGAKAMHSDLDDMKKLKVGAL